jgi:hypothetical protein
MKYGYEDGGYTLYKDAGSNHVRMTGCKDVCRDVRIKGCNNKRL